jgi:ATP-dependent protease ClpP protease subunit
MAKETYVYGDIWDYSALEYIKSVDEAKGQELTTRVNTSGGEPSYAWGMVTKFNEHEGPKTIIIDGKAQSSGFLFVGAAKADKIIAIRESLFLLHRASYRAEVESNPMLFTETMKQNLKIINDGFRANMESKIDVKKFEKITGKTMDQIFSPDNRIDAVLNAEQALEIGLIDEIRDLSAKEKMSIAAYCEASAKADFNPIKEDKPKNEAKKMTIEALKADHPEVYAKVFALGEAKERDRVGAWATYAEADPEAVAKGIKDGSELSMTAMAELNIKMFKKTQVNALATESPKAVATEAPAASAQSEDDKKVEAFFNEIMPKI